MSPQDNDGHCGFDTLFKTNVLHILEDIFFSSDYKSFKTCSEVSKAWNQLFSSVTFQRKLEELLIEKKKNEKKLHLASQEGDIAEARRLICSLMVNVNTVEGNTQFSLIKGTPFCKAAEKGHLDMVQLLLHNGAKVDKADKDGNTPLKIAARHGNLDIVRTLISEGADFEMANGSGITPLTTAAGSGHLDVVKFLVHSGADVNKSEKEAPTPLHCAADGHLDVVEYLLHRGADVEKADRCGGRALFWAAHNCHQDVVQVLLDNEAEIDSTDVGGNNALHQASEGGGTEVVKLLLERGADPNKANNDGDAPLHKVFMLVREVSEHPI